MRQQKTLPQLQASGGVVWEKNCGFVLRFAQLVLEIFRRWGSGMDPPCPNIVCYVRQQFPPIPSFKRPNIWAEIWKLKKKINPFLYRCLGTCGSLLSSTHSWITLNSNCNVWENPNEASFKLFTQEYSFLIITP